MNETLMLQCTEDYRFKKMARYCRGPDILDIGFSQSPNPFLKAKNLVGLDLTVNETPQNYQQVYEGNVANLPQPFRPASFDTIVAGEILEHVEAPLVLLRGAYKTLKPGGRLVLSTPNPFSPPEIICNIFLNRSILYTKEHVTLYPQRWLLRMLELAGFNNLRLLSGGIQFPLVGKGPFPAFGLMPFPRAFCYQTIAIGEKIANTE